MLLAGDIGGTKTDLAIYSLEGGPRKPLAQAEYPSAQYPSLEAIVQLFLSGVKLNVDSACFDVAGPVVGGEAKITNLSWTVKLESLKQELKIDHVTLINDLQAIAMSVPILDATETATLNEGKAVPGGAIAVIAPGTGLGEAFLTWDGRRYHAFASEGGHSDFAPSNLLEIGLLEYLERRLPHVSVERVVSGKGLPNIYNYLRESGYAEETPELAAQLAAAHDPTPIIVDNAMHDTAPNPLCVATLNTFISVMGAEASNLALKVLSTGGVYLAGGIPPRILPALQDGPFMQAFQRKGRLSKLVAAMPVRVILSQAALVGAAHYGLQLARESPQAQEA